jgi:2-phospho-L-lactate guanylyltransferase
VNAKQRLAGVLHQTERQLLFQAMVEDVLLALDQCTLVDECRVVTRDPQVMELASRYRAKVVPEPAEPGLIAAVTDAAANLAAEGVHRMLFVPGDVPLVSVEELDIVLTDLDSPASAPDSPDPAGVFTIVPARDLGGSNCVCCAPPDCMTFGFGEDSFRRHLKIARELGIEPRIAKLPGLGLDVDTPDDLQMLITQLKRSNIQSRTGRFLDESGISERLGSELISSSLG